VLCFGLEALPVRCGAAGRYHAVLGRLNYYDVKGYVILERDSICRAHCMLSPARPSVCCMGGSVKNGWS